MPIHKTETVLNLDHDMPLTHIIIPTILSVARALSRDDHRTILLAVLLRAKKFVKRKISVGGDQPKRTC